MGWNETSVTLVGRIITDVMHRQTSEGVSLCTFRIVSTERRYKPDVREWVDGDQLYLGVTCWRKLAENAAATFAKGDPVIVHGKLRSKFVETEGTRRHFYDVDAVAVGLDVGRTHTMRTAPEIVAPRTEDESVPGTDRELVSVGGPAKEASDAEEPPF